MAALTPADRLAIAAVFSSNLSNTRTEFNLSKADLRAAVAAIDQWVENNTAAFNVAIPQPARSALTPQQKAAIFSYVVQKRLAAA